MDSRPTNCTFRLQDEGKPYPKSGCHACGRNIMTGLGRQCKEGSKVDGLLSDYSSPEASWSDETIVEWARIHGYGHYPVMKFSLANTVRESDPNTVLIYFDKIRSGMPNAVVRLKEPSSDFSLPTSPPTALSVLREWHDARVAIFSCDGLPTMEMWDRLAEAEDKLMREARREFGG